jgi:hypothetical protein
MNVTLDIKRLKDPDHWIRLVAIALFAIFFTYIGYIILIVSLVHFALLSVMGKKNTAIAMYVNQGVDIFNDCLRYILGSSDKKPFNIEEPKK